MALIAGIFIACILFLIAFLPFGLVAMLVKKRSLNSDKSKSTQEKGKLAASIIIIVGFIIAVLVFKSVMGSFIDGLTV
ncbi:hypothetical protein [Oceanobacillus sp. J11TS1]|uniref:hypothetical protein n=1 Tax=Oceanobacillus sp. J11TS1 TaxID=2807191 RepID=UPI001B176EB3|nr:hypothetical protein [Oceanobacillus sp. J11TS1]GIO22537.1 hypothetical protein J11TS1_11180 [Oceanobacillus sp. J11TS1]